MTKDIIVNWFIKNYEQEAIDMINCDHSPRNFGLKYHTEGTVWTHTLMVLTHIETKFDMIIEDLHQNCQGAGTNQVEKNKKILLLAGLLHDIGKPASRQEKFKEERGDYYSFNGHSGISTFMAVGILEKFRNDLWVEMTDEEIKLVLKIVSLHGVAVEGPKNRLKYLREEFRIADKSGAIRKSDEDIYDKYPNRNYSSTKQIQDDKEVIVMVGLPCSGKSTEVSNNLQDYYSLSRDEELSKFDPENTAAMTYSETFKFIHNDPIKLEAFNLYFNKKIKEVSSKYNKVVIDMTMMSLKSRRSMLNCFPKHSRKCIVMIPSLETTYERNKNRTGKVISDDVYKSMMTAFIMPTKEEGFTNIDLKINQYS